MKPLPILSALIAVAAPWLLLWLAHTPAWVFAAWVSLYALAEQLTKLADRIEAELEEMQEEGP